MQQFDILVVLVLSVKELQTIPGVKHRLLMGFFGLIKICHKTVRRFFTVL
jgi:hypothetical protein